MQQLHVVIVEFKINSTIPPPLCSTMKVVFLLALVGFTCAFDFPEDWEAWKQVGDVCHGHT